VLSFRYYFKRYLTACEREGGAQLEEELLDVCDE
jgi:hypothetical protein